MQTRAHPGTAQGHEAAKGVDMSDGTIDNAKGRGKEALGDLTGDKDLKNEGKVDRASGKTKDAVGGIADKAKKMLRKD
ncbi:MAG TPA: CsbD family protein [Solirubrobacteraceae bacterium]|nr:CsbD family protein [Solirubrobacteraceae bacterium]